MKAKEVVHEVFDIDQGLLKTFFRLFTNPKDVVDHPDQYMRPWRYATYVVSIASLFYYLVIHWLDDPAGKMILWDAPQQLIQLTTGYYNFYEATQPLKRLVLGALAFYLPLLLLFFSHRTSLLRISIYLFSQSVFTVFILQSLRILILGGGFGTQGDATLGMITHIGYLVYAGNRVLSFEKPLLRAIKTFVLIIVTFTIYNITSQEILYRVFYDVVNHGKSHALQPANEVIFSKKNVALTQHPENENQALDTVREKVKELRTVTIGGKRLALLTFQPKGEIALLTLQCSPDSAVAWSTIIFDKDSRYSPNPKQILMETDSARNQVWVMFRLPDDLQSTIRLFRLSLSTGAINFQQELDLQTDNLTLHCSAQDAAHIYLAGSAAVLSRNSELGLLLAVNKSTAQIRHWFFGENSFSSKTHSDKIILQDQKVIIQASRTYRWFRFFNRTEGLEFTADRSNLN